ncbi:peptide/nickel transport system permease protein [Haloactinopolyspora alba]|uniref:Peptide/nickel transport system permease protein n=1 Tax=Haloactinopolyspora alba TaxID=648780 RepID=A0A2P8E7S8_9ACTN|nr:ABC transporter permease [Haloactinopolyspora alba]PSL05478.1 peptide/nickel transport system permease protein [Haloactinopolyspora alba]
MLRFVIRRTLYGVLVIWVISVVVFVLFFVAPRNVARKLAGRQADMSAVEAIREDLGLNRPLLEQYGDFLWGLLQGDLGYSYYSDEPVTDKILDALPISVSLAAGAAVIWVVLGVSIGVLSALRPRTIADRAATTFALFFYSMPTFLLGLLLLYFLFYQLHLVGIDWFPAATYVPLTEDVGQWARHLILPWITLALVLTGTYIRLTRGSMLDALGEDYIRTARSKGITESRVTVRHALRGGITPVVTQFGIDFGTLVGGVLITEQVFGLQGLGYIAVTSVVQGDLPVVIGVVMVASAFTVVASIVVDFSYAVLDPRVRLT